MKEDNNQKKDILTLDSVTSLIKERFLVQSVSFSLKKGEILGLIGSDQSGKTSVLKVILGALPLTEGAVFYNGVDMKQNKALRQNISIALDPPMFSKYQTVKENLKYLSSLKGNYSVERLNKILKIFDLQRKKNVKVVKLSYFEKKKMAIALAVMNKTQVILLDEPFKSLSKKFTDKLKKYLRALAKNSVSIILTSETSKAVEDVCDRFVLMSNRQVQKIVKNDEIIKYTSKHEYTYIKVKYPNFAGKLIFENFKKNVKLMDNRVLFMDEKVDNLVEIIKFLTDKKITIYGAGKLKNKAEMIFADLSSYYQEEQ